MISFIVFFSIYIAKEIYLETQNKKNFEAQGDKKISVRFDLFYLF